MLGLGSNLYFPNPLGIVFAAAILLKASNRFMKKRYLWAPRPVAISRSAYEIRLGRPDRQCVLGWSEIFPSLTRMVFHTVGGGALDAPFSQNSALIAGRHECRPLHILRMFFRLPYHKIFLSYGDALRERFLREGACPCGSKDSTPLLSRILWVLSWRSKKVPPHALHS